MNEKQPDPMVKIAEGHVPSPNKKLACHHCYCKKAHNQRCCYCEAGGTRCLSLL